MLDEVRRGCPSPQTMQALEERVITTPVVDKFDELLTSKQSPLCLFPTRKASHEFNSNMLSRLQAETQEIPCTDEVNETVGTFKWTKKAAEEMQKLNSDCNLTAGLEAVLRVAVGARVMLRRNIDTSQGLVNGAIGTVISIKAHHISVHFDNMSHVYDVEKVKSKFMVMKIIFLKTVPIDSGICCYYTQVPRPLTRLCYDGPFRISQHLSLIHVAVCEEVVYNPSLDGEGEGRGRRRRMGRRRRRRRVRVKQ